MKTAQEREKNEQGNTEGQKNKKIMLLQTREQYNKEKLNKMF